MSDEEKKVEATESTENTAPEAATEEKAPEVTTETAEQTEEKAPEAAEIPEVEEDAPAEELPHENIVPGMLVRVHEKIKDTNSRGEERERVQIFEGMVIGVRGGGVSRTVTVRKNSKGWMVEKIFPLSSPNIEKIEVVKQYRVRRAKLNHLRGRFKRKLKEVK